MSVLLIVVVFVLLAACLVDREPAPTPGELSITTATGEVSLAKGGSCSD